MREICKERKQTWGIIYVPQMIILRTMDNRLFVYFHFNYKYKTIKHVKQDIYNTYRELSPIYHIFILLNFNRYMPPVKLTDTERIRRTY